MAHGSLRSSLLRVALLSAALGSACGKAFTVESQDDLPPVGGAGSGGGSGPGSSVGGASAGDLGAGGSPSDGGCERDEDCSASPSVCLRVACLEGACTTSPVSEGSECEGGTCDAEGRCAASPCDSGQMDGDETGVDCGGSCALCPDAEGCVAGTDCLSGVCADGQCQASACTDEFKNGDETGVDCGGSCPLNCALGDGCAVTPDCAVPTGERAESVRCVAGQCVSTKPPSEAGAPLYWQDFAPERLMAKAESCSATDKVCLVGATALYQMGGLGTDGNFKALTKELLFTPEGAVGGGGVFNGTMCLTRPGTDLSLHGLGALTAMAWVRSTRPKAPWEGALIGALSHYFIAVDANPASERFLAAVATSQSTTFDYRSSTGTAEVGAGQWHHVAATYDTAAAKLLQYVDGKLVNTTTLAGNVTTGPVNVYLGCRKDAAVGQFFWGYLDEVVVYRRAVSAMEIADYVKRTAP